MKCHFCHRTTEEPIEEGWFPSYWDCSAQSEISEPVCNVCLETRLRTNHETGDYELSVSQKFRLLMEKRS